MAKSYKELLIFVLCSLLFMGLSVYFEKYSMLILFMGGYYTNKICNVVCDFNDK